jgi:transposase-like protein
MGIRYRESTIFEICRRIDKGEISYSDAQREYGVKSQGSFGPWLRKYRAGLLPCIEIDKYEDLSKEELIKALEESNRCLESPLAHAFRVCFRIKQANINHC